jgi:hypothetical protein
MIDFLINLWIQTVERGERVTIDPKIKIKDCLRLWEQGIRIEADGDKRELILAKES